MFVSKLHQILSSLWSKPVLHFILLHGFESKHSVVVVFRVS